MPRWLWPILRRGLAAQPEQRWPGIQELIAAIERARLARRKRVAVLGVSLVTLTVAGLSGLAVTQFGALALDDCSVLDAELSETWDANRVATAPATLGHTKPAPKRNLRLPHSSAFRCRCSSSPS